MIDQYIHLIFFANNSGPHVDGRHSNSSSKRKIFGISENSNQASFLRVENFGVFLSPWVFSVPMAGSLGP